MAFEVGGALSRAPRAASRSWKGQEADSPAGLPEGNAALLGPWFEPNEMAPDFRLPALLVLKPLCLWSFVTAAEGNENCPLQACPPPRPRATCSLRAGLALLPLRPRARHSLRAQQRLLHAAPAPEGVPGSESGLAWRPRLSPPNPDLNLDAALGLGDPLRLRDLLPAQASLSPGRVAQTEQTLPSSQARSDQRLLQELSPRGVGGLWVQLKACAFLDAGDSGFLVTL